MSVIRWISVLVAMFGVVAAASPASATRYHVFNKSNETLRLCFDVDGAEGWCATLLSGERKWIDLPAKGKIELYQVKPSGLGKRIVTKELKNANHIYLNKNTIELDYVFTNFLPELNSPLKIQNVTGARAKTCFYHANDAVLLAPRQCITLEPNEAKWWTRGDIAPFQMKTFIPGVIDRPLMSERVLPAATRQVFLMRSGGQGFLDYEMYTPANLPRRPKKDFGKRKLTVCNKTQPAEVVFALGFRYDDYLTGAGWYGVKQGECETFPMDRFTIAPDHTWPEIYFYGMTDGPDQRLYYEGGEGAQRMCVEDGTFLATYPIAGFDQSATAPGVVLEARCPKKGSEIVEAKRYRLKNENTRHVRLNF